MEGQNGYEERVNLLRTSTEIQQLDDEMIQAYQNDSKQDDEQQDDEQQDDEKENDDENDMNDFSETFETQFRPFDHSPSPRYGRNTVGRRSRGRGRPAGRSAGNTGVRGRGSSRRARRGRGSRRGSVSRTSNANIADVVDNEATDMTVEEFSGRPEETDITEGVDINVSGEKRKRGKHQYQSCRQHYAYRMQQRVDDDNILVKGRKLFQQYCCDMYIKIEGLRLKFFRTHQSEIRSEEYDAYQTEIQKGTQGGNVGKPVILPSSFTGGPRYQVQLYQDAMALVRKFGKPDFFVTMTANPKWVEITRNLTRANSI
jgi:hypothetical protein